MIRLPFVPSDADSYESLFWTVDKDAECVQSSESSLYPATSGLTESSRFATSSDNRSMSSCNDLQSPDSLTGLSKSAEYVEPMSGVFYPSKEDCTTDDNEIFHVIASKHKRRKIYTDEIIISPMKTNMTENTENFRPSSKMPPQFGIKRSESTSTKNKQINKSLSNDELKFDAHTLFVITLLGMTSNERTQYLLELAMERKLIQKKGNTLNVHSDLLRISDFVKQYHGRTMRETEKNEISVHEAIIKFKECSKENLLTKTMQLKSKKKSPSKSELKAMIIDHNINNNFNKKVMPDLPKTFSSSTIESTKMPSPVNESAVPHFDVRKEFSKRQQKYLLEQLKALNIQPVTPTMVTVSEPVNREGSILSGKKLVFNNPTVQSLETSDSTMPMGNTESATNNDINSNNGEQNLPDADNTLNDKTLTQSSADGIVESSSISLDNLTSSKSQTKESYYARNISAFF